MKRFVIISAALHVALFLIFTFGNLSFFFRQPEFKQTNTIRVEFLDKLPTTKNISKPVVSKPIEKPKPKEENKETSPPPKPAPGIKTKVTAPISTKKELTKEEPKKVTAPKPKEKTILKKNKAIPPKQKLDKKLEETAKKHTKQDPKQDSVTKPSPGIEKKKQEIESVDALLNTLLPDVGGKRDETAKELREEDASEMPEDLENEAIYEIKSQIEAVWNYNPTDGIDFTLRITLDPTGKVLDVKPPSGTENQNALQQAAAEAAYRATKRLGQFELKPHIFKLEYHENGWGEIEVHFQPGH